MPHCSASYKLAIRFVNWTKKKGHFYHPFERYRKASGFDAGKWWLKLKRHEAFDYACFSTPYLCDAMRSPRFLDGTVYDSKVRSYYSEHAAPPNTRIAGHEVQYPYGYHFNAAELAAYLQGYAVERGTTRLLDEVGHRHRPWWRARQCRPPRRPCPRRDSWLIPMLRVAADSLCCHENHVRLPTPVRLVSRPTGGSGVPTCARAGAATRGCARSRLCVRLWPSRSSQRRAAWWGSRSRKVRRMSCETGTRLRLPVARSMTGASSP